MSVQVQAENELLREVSQVLLEHLSPAKVVRFWASWHIGKGDYQEWRDETFADESVGSLYEQIEAFQQRDVGE